LADPKQCGNESSSSEQCEEFLDLHMKEVAAPWNQQSERKFN